MANHIAFENWTPELVVQWLSGLDDTIQPYVQFFLNNGIDGRKLLMLAHSDLERMNVVKLGHQELILEAVDMLRTLRYGYESENLQFLALQLGCKARSLHNEIQAQTAENDKNKANMTQQDHNRKRLSINNLSSVANLLIALKNLVSWLDRSPFEGTHELCLRRNTIVKTGLDLVTASQKEANIYDIEDAIMKSCTRLADVCDELVIESRDPMFVQPASLEVASIRKKPGEELGMHIQSLYYGIYQIGGIKDMSPAELCGKIEKGDEVIQVNGQTVVGWQLKSLVNALKEKPKEVILLLKKRPHHTSPFGQMQNKKKQINKAQVATLPKSLKKRRSREGEQKQTRPMLQDLMNKTPSSEEPNSPKEATDGNDTDNDVFRSGSESPQYTLPVQVDPKQRRATVSGGSPTLSRPLLVTEDLDTPTRPKSFAVASIDAPHALTQISPTDEKGKELRLGDKLKNSTAAERRQEFKATKSVPQTLEFTVKKPIPKVKEPEKEEKSSESEQCQKNANNSDKEDIIPSQLDDIKTETKDITFKVSIEHSDADEMQLQTVPASSESSAFKTVPQIIEMPPQNEAVKSGIPITPEIQIHIHDAGVSPDDPQPEIDPLQMASVIFSTADENSSTHLTKHSVRVQAQLVDIASSDSTEPAAKTDDDEKLPPIEKSEDKSLCFSPQVSSDKKHSCSSSKESSEDKLRKGSISNESSNSPENSSAKPLACSVDSSQTQDTSQEDNFSNVSVVRRTKSKIDVDVNTNTRNIQLTAFRKISSTELSELDFKLDDKKSEKKTTTHHKKVEFAEPIKQNPEPEKVVSYKYIVVAGQVQKIPDDGTSQISPVVRRKTTKRVDRRVSCKDLGKCDCEGWLLKHKGKNVGPLSKQWHKRWCVLKNSNFFYYRNKTDLKAEGVVHLPAFQVSPAPEIKSKKKIAFKVHNPGTSFYFASERQDDMSKWMNKMGLAAIVYSDKELVTTGGFQKPGSRVAKSEDDYYSESEDEDDDSSPEKCSSKSSSPASIRSEKAGSPSTMPRKMQPGSSSPVSTGSPKMRSSSKEGKKADGAIGSTDDLTVLYRNLQKENLTLMGKDRRTAMSTNLDLEKSPEQLNKVLKLTSLQRTLKAKEHELQEIQQLLSSKITHSKLSDFSECHAIPGSAHSHSPQSSDTDTL